MSEAMKLVAFVGSLRQGSFNRMALHAFVERLPAGVSVQEIEIGDWPLYNFDIQAKGFPGNVEAAQKTMLAADGIVLVTPEYNYGVSGVLKNAIDWLSRTTPQPFAAKPIAIFGASGGLLGTARAMVRLSVRRSCPTSGAPMFDTAAIQSSSARSSLAISCTRWPSL